jgi:hypothetical protein
VLDEVRRRETRGVVARQMGQPCRDEQDAHGL